MRCCHRSVGRFRRLHWAATALVLLAIPLLTGKLCAAGPEVRLRFMAPVVAARMQLRSLVPDQTTSLVAYNGSVIIGVQGRIVAYNRWSGKEFASLAVSGTTHRCLLAAEMIFGCTDEGTVVAWNGNNGNPLWQVTLDEPLGDSISRSGKCLLVASRTGSLWCLDPESGVVGWKYSSERRDDSVQVPVVQFASAGSDTVLVWRATGELLELSFQKNNFRIRSRRQIDPLELTLAGAPLVRGEQVLLPASQGKSLLLPRPFDDRSLAGEFDDGLNQLSLWHQATGAVRENPLQLFHHRQKGVLWADSDLHLVALRAALSAENPVAIVFDGAAEQLGSEVNWSRSLVIDSSGTLWRENRPVQIPWVGGIASNVLVLPGRRLNEQDLYWISSRGWMYRFSFAPNQN